MRKFLSTFYVLFLVFLGAVLVGLGFHEFLHIVFNSDVPAEKICLYVHSEEDKLAEVQFGNTTMSASAWDDKTNTDHSLIYPLQGIFTAILFGLGIYAFDLNTRD